MYLRSTVYGIFIYKPTGKVNDSSVNPKPTAPEDECISSHLV